MSAEHTLFISAQTKVIELIANKLRTMEYLKLVENLTKTTGLFQNEKLVYHIGDRNGRSMLLSLFVEDGVLKFKRGDKVDEKGNYKLDTYDLQSCVSVLSDNTVSSYYCVADWLMAVYDLHFSEAPVLKQTHLDDTLQLMLNMPAETNEYDNRREQLLNMGVEIHRGVNG